MSAAPVMTSMVQSQYAAAPTMTSMYNNGASVYMPAQTMAAPVVTETVSASMVMAAPQVVTAPTAVVQSPSYVAAPVAAAQTTVVKAPSFVAAPLPVAVSFSQTRPPIVKLTEGLVTPAKIEEERLAYERALAAQLKKQSDAVFAESELKKQMMDQARKTQMAQFELQLDEQYKLACLQVDQDALRLVDGLKEAAITQQTAREENAARAVADYNKKLSLDEYQEKSWNVQKQWYDQEQKLVGEYEAAMKSGAGILGSMNVAQVNVGAPAQYASYAAAPQYVSQPQYASYAATQYGATVPTTFVAAPTVVETVTVA
jgi:hypothetical protein